MEKGGIMNGNSSVNREEIEVSPELKLSHAEAENILLKSKIEELTKKNEEEKVSVYTIIHDGKNKLNPILGLAGLLIEDIKEGNYNKEETLKCLEAINTSAQNALIMFKDFLELEKSGSIKIEAKMEIINIKQFVEMVLFSLKNEIEKKEISLSNNIEQNISVMADQNMLASVLDNLIQNAIKFSNIKTGQVEVFSKARDGEIKIYISDNGRGISKEKQEKLFDSLGETTLGTNGEEGTGFGLYTCKKLIEKMNGTIEVESEGLGKGTTFIITLKSK